MDPFAELAALEASSSAAMAGAPEPAPAPAPVAATTAPAMPAPAAPSIQVSIAGQPELPQGVVELPYTPSINLNPTLIPQAPAAPAPPEPPPAAEPAPTPPNPSEPAPPAPAPALETAPQPPPGPAPLIPDKIERRVYLHDGLSDASRLAITIMAKNPDLTPVEAATLANQRLGLAVPISQPVAQPQAQPPAAPEAPVATAESVQARLAAIRSDLAGMDPVLNPEGFRDLTLEGMELQGKLPHLLFQEAQAAQQQHQQLAATSDAQIEQSMAAARALYPDLSQADSLFSQTFNQELSALVESNHPLTAMPNCEELLAYHVAARLGILPSNVTPQAPPASTPQPPAVPVAPVPSTAAPSASPAAPQPAAAAVPSPAQPGALPAAGMGPVSGAQTTSADRVTHASPVDPHAALQQSYQQAVAAGDYAAMERISAQLAVPANLQIPQGYGAPPPAFAISFGSVGSAAA